MHPGPKDKDMFLIVSHVCAAGFVFFSCSLLVGGVLGFPFQFRLCAECAKFGQIFAPAF